MGALHGDKPCKGDIVLKASMYGKMPPLQGLISFPYDNPSVDTLGYVMPLRWGFGRFHRNLPYIHNPSVVTLGYVTPPRWGFGGGTAQ